MIVRRNELCKTINDYLVIGLLGRESFSSVELVGSITTSQKPAMKILPQPEAKANMKHCKAIQREIAVMKYIKHPSMVPLYEMLVNAKSGKLYLALPHISGGTISKKLTRTTVEPIEEKTLRSQAPAAA